MRDPLVSIIINNYNYGRFLRDAIDSALNQTYSNIEVIVVDDGSTDDSREIIAAYGKRIIPVLKENGGQATAFNEGFKASQGEMICFLDADDWFASNKVEVIIRQFEKNPGFGWIAHGMSNCDNDGNAVEIIEDREQNNSKPASADYSNFVRSGNCRQFPYLPPTSALVFKRSVLKKTAPTPEGLKITADNYLKLSGLLVAPVLFVDDNLSTRRIHGDNLYTNKDSRTKTFKKLSRSINIHISLGLMKLDGKQKTSRRIILGNIKSSLKDMCVRDLVINVATLFSIILRRLDC